MSRIIKLLSLLAFVISLVSLSLAQGSLGNIVGTVSDSSGAEIPGATIKIKNIKTNAVRETVSDEEGAYTVNQLIPGIYEITASATGFTTATAKEIKVSVSFTTKLDLELQPGEVSEVVQVDSSNQQNQINTSDQQLSTLIDNKKILKLPLLGRDASSLVLLTPGVNVTPQGGFAVNGSRETNNNIRVDGVDGNDSDEPSGDLISAGANFPNIDATQEFRIISANFNAEYGRNTGAIINLETKGGSNEFHGGLYEYNRSDKFSARNFFDITGKADPLSRNQFGGTVSGPIKKDQTFFFFNYERNISDVGLEQLRTVPSALARQGIFPGTVFGTLDIRANSSNNINNLSLNPAIAQIINSVYPLGNDPARSLLPGTLDGYRFVFTSPTRGNDISTRIDQQLGTNEHLFGRYGISKSTTIDPETFPGFNDGNREFLTTQLFALGLTSIITPKLVNEFRFGVNRVNFQNPGPGDKGVPAPVDVAIMKAFANNSIPLTQLPFGGSNGQAFTFELSGLTSLHPVDPETRFSGTTNISNATTYVRNTHTFKAGIETRLLYSNTSANIDRRESLAFNLPTSLGMSLLTDSKGNPIAPIGTGGILNDFAGFLYGLVGIQSQTQFFNKSNQRVDSSVRGFRTRDLDWFVQDNWKVRPNFTLNYGLRYEYKGVPYEVNGQLSTLIDQNPGDFTPVGGFKFTTVGKNSDHSNLQLYNNDLNNYAPRFGFAWDPFNDGKTSIRGGYGVFYDRVFADLFKDVRSNPPFENSFELFPGNKGLASALLQNLPRVPTIKTSFKVFDKDLLFPTIFPYKSANGNNLYQQELRSPYSQTVNFGLQHNFKGFIMEADYIFSKGAKLITTIDGNMTSVARKNYFTGANNAISPNPTVNFFNGSLNTAFFQAAIYLTSAFSTYHGSTFRVTKDFDSEKYGTGEIQVAYTYSHSIDNAEEPVAAFLNGRTFPVDSSGYAGGFNRPERGSSSTDIRQRLVMNFTYDLPFKFKNKRVALLLGDWSLGGIIQAQTGRPFSVFYDIDTQGTDHASLAQYAFGNNGITIQPNLNPRIQTGPKASLFLDPNKANALGQPGNVPRNSFVGPGFNKVDLSVTKQFKLTERHKLSFNADFFNIFNRVNLGLPVNVATNDLFGQSLTASEPRIVQFVFRYNF